MAAAAMEGLDADGGMWYEYEPANNHLVKEKHWWPQAEAMVGFFNAWEAGGEKIYLDTALSSWNFIKAYIRDREHGEWVWGVYPDYAVIKDKDKVGIWKCPLSQRQGLYGNNKTHFDHWSQALTFIDYSKGLKFHFLFWEIWPANKFKILRKPLWVTVRAPSPSGEGRGEVLFLFYPIAGCSVCCFQYYFV